MGIKLDKQMDDELVIIEICGRNQDFYRMMQMSDLVATSKLSTLQERHDQLWKLSQSTKISSSSEIDYAIVDNQDDPELTEESWTELIEVFTQE